MASSRSLAQASPSASTQKRLVSEDFYKVHPTITNTRSEYSVQMDHNSRTGFVLQTGTLSTAKGKRPTDYILDENKSKVWRPGHVALIRRIDGKEDQALVVKTLKLDKKEEYYMVVAMVYDRAQAFQLLQDTWQRNRSLPRPSLPRGPRHFLSNKVELLHYHSRVHGLRQLSSPPIRTLPNNILVSSRQKFQLKQFQQNPDCELSMAVTEMINIPSSAVPAVVLAPTLSSDVVPAGVSTAHPTVPAGMQNTDTASGDSSNLTTVDDPAANLAPAPSGDVVTAGGSAAHPTVPAQSEQDVMADSDGLEHELDEASEASEAGLPAELTAENLRRLSQNLPAEPPLYFLLPQRN